jgi:hypothetical protein
MVEADRDGLPPPAIADDMALESGELEIQQRSLITACCYCSMDFSSWESGRRCDSSCRRVLPQRRIWEEPR